MNKICRFTMFFLFCLLTAGQVQAQQHSYEFRIIYGFMKARDIRGLQNAMSNGVWIDAPDSNGINSLCHTVYQQDYEGYELLTALQADPDPACLRRMSKRYKQAFFKNLPKNNRYAYLYPPEKKEFFTRGVRTGITLTAVAAGAAIGIAGGGGGGGSGGDDGYTPGAPLPDPEIPTNVVYSAPDDKDPEAFKTASYEAGGFLSQINANNAYARGYNGYKIRRDSEGYLLDENNQRITDITDGSKAITAEKNKIAVIDNGIMSTHEAFKGKDGVNIIKQGLNFDYGPCSSANTSNCYLRENGNLIFRNDTTSYTMGTIDEETWNEYTASYKNGYVWNKTDTSPHDAEDGHNGESHGTHVTGIIAANPDYVGSIDSTDNPPMQGITQAEIIPVIYDKIGGFSIGTPWSEIADKGVSVVNMSFGYDANASMNAGNVADIQGIDALFNTQDMINLFSKNIVMVVAAGNESYSDSQALSGIPNLVAEANGLFINVVSVDENNQLASYSNACGSTKGWCIAAPGGSSDNPIYSTMIDGYGDMMGTSMAAPVVTGSVNLLLNAFPHLTPQQAVDIIFATATDLGDSNKYGHGLLNLDAATNPVGDISIPAGDTASSSLLAFNGTRVTLPYNMGAVMDKLPENIIILDKYARAYPVKTANMFKVAENKDTLKNNMKHFMNHKAVRKIALNDNVSMSFSDRVSDPSENNMLLGSMEFDYHISNQSSMGFFYTENTLYKHGDYFSKTTANPFLNMNDAVGIKSEYAFNSKLNFNVAVYSGKNGFYNDDYRLSVQNDNRFNALDYSFNYSPSSLVTFGLKSGFLQEDGSVLGMKGSGALTTDNSLTTYAGLEVKVTPSENLSVTAAYYQGRSKSDSAKDSLISMSELESESIALDVAYKLDEQAQIGFLASSPLSVTNGNMLMDVPVGRDPHEDKVYREKYSLSMEPEAKEFDLGLYYTHETEDEKWFRAEFTTRLNPDNRDIDPDYQLMIGFGAPLN